MVLRVTRRQRKRRSFGRFGGFGVHKQGARRAAAPALIAGLRDATMEAAAVDERPPEARFTIGENIGQGAFGMVYRGVENDTGVPPRAEPPDPH